MALDFTGRNALVLGGNDPLSAAIAERLTRQGANVWSHADGTGLVRGAVDRGWEIDILVLAPDITSEATFLDLDEDEFERVLDTQLRSAVRAVIAALPHFRSNGQGRIVTCVPSSAVFGSASGIAKSVAGSGLLSLAKSIAHMANASQIRSNAVSFIAAMPSNDTLFKKHPLVPSQLFSVDVILPAITYLAHQDCMLNGEVISAGAGRFAKATTSITLGGFDPAIADDQFAELLPKITDERSTFTPNTVLDELITIAV